MRIAIKPQMYKIWREYLIQCSQQQKSSPMMRCMGNIWTGSDIICTQALLHSSPCSIASAANNPSINLMNGNLLSGFRGRSGFLLLLLLIPQLLLTKEAAASFSSHPTTVK